MGGKKQCSETTATPRHAQPTEPTHIHHKKNILPNLYLLAKESLVKDQTPTPTETTTESETKAHRHRAIALLFRMMVKVMQVFLCCALLVSTVLAQENSEGSPDSDNTNPDRSGGGNGGPGDNLPPATDVDEIDVQSCNLTIGYYVSFFLFLRSSKILSNLRCGRCRSVYTKKNRANPVCALPVARFIYPGFQFNTHC